MNFDEIWSKLKTMFAQSRDVLTQRNVATFEKYEKDGDLRDAVIYVAVFALISGILGFTTGPLGVISSVITTVAGFLVFVYIVHWLGKRNGGTGTIDEVAYSFSLFWGPVAALTAVASLVLLVTIVGIFLIPLLLIASLVVNVWFSYMATQSSLNLPAGGPTWMVLILAALATFLVNVIVGAILL